MLSQEYNIIIDSGVVAPTQVRKVVDTFNDMEKRFLSMLITTVQLTGGVVYGTHMVMHTSTMNKDISIVT